MSSSVKSGSDATARPSGESEQPAPSNASTSKLPTPQATAQEPHAVSKVRFVLIFLSLMLCVFLFALDQLIVATAIPKITDEFNSLTQVSWIANGFFLTLLAFNLAFAQWTAIFPSKHVALFAVAVFEIGSLLCGAAPNMPVLILGRAISGAGGAGIFNSALMILTEITTMQERARIFGLMGVNFAVASVTGPLIGGAFADHISWRWCFYINLPIGGIAFALMFLLVKTNPPYGRSASYKGYGRHMFQQLAECDWVGVAIVLAWGCVSVLALQEGGVTEAWNNGSVIAELVMIPVLAVVFVAWEIYLGDKAMLPMKLFKRRTVTLAVIIAIFTQGPFVFLVYYLAEGYQALYHTSATRSGIELLPLIIVNVATLISAGRIIARTGRPYYVMILGPAIMTVGCGLLYSVKLSNSKSYPMGYSAFIGFGVGLVLQNVIICAQHEFHKEPQYVAIGTGAVTFAGFIGRLYGIGMAGSIFGNMIQKNIHKYAPNLAPNVLKEVQNNANGVWTSVPEDQRQAVREAYLKTLNDVYLIGVPMGAIAVIAALCMRNVKMDFSHGRPAPAAKDAEEAPADAPAAKTVEDAESPAREEGAEEEKAENEKTEA